MKSKINVKVVLVYVCVLLLVSFGCLMVFSASSYSAEYHFGNKYHFLIKQIISVFLGFFCMVFFSFFDYKKLKKYKWFSVIFSAILLVLVFMPFIGVKNYGAKRWINLGFFTVQPSEIAKFALVLFSSVYLSENYENIKHFKSLIPVLVVGILFCMLVILEPNMSITMCIGLVMLFMLFIGGASLKHFCCLCIPVLILVPILIFLEPYRVKRLMAFLNPWASPQGEGFQLIQSLYSLGSGGMFGVGFFNSRQKYLFLPFSESDFIFSIIGEECGLFGCLVLMSLFLFLIFLLVSIGKSSKDRFGCLLSLGIASVIAIQVIINIAVVTGTIPPTGIPLPFISAGSTSLIVFMSAVGVCVNIERQSKKQSKNEMIPFKSNSHKKFNFFNKKSKV